MDLNVYKEGRLMDEKGSCDEVDKRVSRCRAPKRTCVDGLSSMHTDADLNEWVGSF